MRKSEEISRKFPRNERNFQEIDRNGPPYKIHAFLLEFRVLRHEHTRYACCACIKEKQIVVTTEFCNQQLRNFATMNSSK